MSAVVPRSILARVALFGALVLLLDLLTGSPSRAATDPQLTITAIRPAYSIPDTIGDYPLVSTGDPFSVDVRVDVVLSMSRATPLVLTADSGPEAGKVLARTSLPAGATTATFTGAVLTKEALEVRLVAAVDKRNPGVVPGSALVDVLDDVVATGPASTLLAILGGGGVGQACDPTPSSPICLELHGGAVSDQLLGEGQCDPSLGCTDSPSFTWLSTVATVSRMVVKCDKTRCRGSGVPHFILRAQLTRHGEVFDLLDCPTADTVGPDRRPCVAGGRRSNTSDLILDVNWIDDGRIVIK